MGRRLKGKQLQEFEAQMAQNASNIKYFIIGAMIPLAILGIVFLLLK